MSAPTPIPGHDGGSNAVGDLSSADAATRFQSAAAFVESGIQDPNEDACSICLEIFTDDEPSTRTSCKHEYHLQCILEWAQRSQECPMCWQPLSLQDPDSQELLAACSQERAFHAHSVSPPSFLRSAMDDYELHRFASSYPDESDLERRIMQHLAAAAAGMSRARSSYGPGLRRSQFRFDPHSLLNPPPPHPHHFDHAGDGLPLRARPSPPVLTSPMNTPAGSGSETSSAAVTPPVSSPRRGGEGGEIASSFLMAPFSSIIPPAPETENNYREPARAATAVAGNGSTLHSSTESEAAGGGDGCQSSAASALQGFVADGRGSSYRNSDRSIGASFGSSSSTGGNGTGSARSVYGDKDEESPQSLGDMFKSRIAAASSRYRDSFSKGTRTFRDRLRLRGGAVADLSARAREVGAGVVRALERIADPPPDRHASLDDSGDQVLPSTSSPAESTDMIASHLDKHEPISSPAPSSIRNDQDAASVEVTAAAAAGDPAGAATVHECVSSPMDGMGGMSSDVSSEKVAASPGTSMSRGSDIGMSSMASELRPFLSA